MDPLTILALIRAGVTTWESIRAAHAAGKIEMTDEQVNQILDGIIKDAEAHAAIAEKEAKGE